MTSVILVLGFVQFPFCSVFVLAEKLVLELKIFSETDKSFSNKRKSRERGKNAKNLKNLEKSENLAKIFKNRSKAVKVREN